MDSLQPTTTTNCFFSNSSHERLADYSKERAPGSGSASCVVQPGMDLDASCCDDPFENLQTFPMAVSCAKKKQKLDTALSTAEFLLSLPIDSSSDPIMSSSAHSIGNSSRKSLRLSPKPSSKLSCSDRLKLSLTSVLTDDSKSEANLPHLPVLARSLSAAAEETEVTEDSASTINFSLRRAEKKPECKRTPMRKQHSSTEWLHFSLKNLMIDSSSDGSQLDESIKRAVPQRTVSLPLSVRRKRPSDTASKQTLDSAKGILREKGSAVLTRSRSPSRRQLPTASQSFKSRRGLSPIRRTPSRLTSPESLDDLLKTAKERSSSRVILLGNNSEHSSTSKSGKSPKPQRCKMTRLHVSTSNLLNAKNHSLLTESMQTPTLTRKASSSGSMRTGRSLSPSNSTESMQQASNSRLAVDPRKALSKEASTSKLATLAMLSRSESDNSVAESKKPALKREASTAKLATLAMLNRSQSMKNLPQKATAALANLQDAPSTSNAKRPARRRTVSPVRARQLSPVRAPPQREKTPHPLDTSSNHELRTPMKRARFGSINNLAALAMAPPLPVATGTATTATMPKDVQMSRAPSRRNLAVDTSMNSSNHDPSHVFRSRIVRYQTT